MLQYTKQDRWLAPEVLKTGDHTPQSDVWSLGATLFEIFMQGILFLMFCTYQGLDLQASHGITGLP